MRLPLKLLQEISDIIQTQPGTKPPEIPGFDTKTFPIPDFRFRVEPPAQNLIHGGFEGSTAFPHFGSQLFRYIVIKSQSRSHVLMLFQMHHDVK